jgi:hypothetical protein
MGNAGERLMKVRVFACSTDTEELCLCSENITPSEISQRGKRKYEKMYAALRSGKNNLLAKEKAGVLYAIILRTWIDEDIDPSSLANAY